MTTSHLARPYSRLIVSPEVMSLAASNLRSGVSKLRRPSFYAQDQSLYHQNQEAICTSSSFPQNHAAPGGAPSIAGRSGLFGRLLELGSNVVVMLATVYQMS